MIAFAALPFWFWDLSIRELMQPDKDIVWADATGQHYGLCWWRDFDGDGQAEWAGLQIGAGLTFQEFLQSGLTAPHFDADRMAAVCSPANNGCHP